MKHETFSEYLERRDEAIRPAGVDRPASTDHEPRATDGAAGAAHADGPRAMGDPAHRPDHFGERSLFRGMFRAVNLARPTSPSNSRFLPSPFRKRLGCQVIGR